MVNNPFTASAVRVGSRLFKTSTVIVCLVLSFANAGAQPPGKAVHDRQIQQWRAQRLDSLKKPDSWLTLVGLFWLDAGENRFGTDPANDMVLPEGSGPPFSGSFFLDENERVYVRSGSDAQLTLRGEQLTERRLRADDDEEPDIMRLGHLSFSVIRRVGRVAIRVKDPGSPARLNFKGLDYYPVRWDHRVTAEFFPYESPREVVVPTVLGMPERMLAAGRAKFSFLGHTHTLEPFVRSVDDTELFFIFKDETSGKATYPAGRYLYAQRRAGHIILDFNKAYNPPCAFTAYATCSYPTKQNWLAIPIEAGEKNY